MEVKTARGYRCLAVALGLLVGLASSGAALAEWTSDTELATVNVAPAPWRLQIGPFAVATPIPGYDPINDTFGVLASSGIEYDDPTGTGAGWHVTLKFGDFRDAAKPYSHIPASNTSVRSVGTIGRVVGQEVDPAGGPFAVEASVGLSLEVERALVTTEPGFGDGIYRHVAFEVGLVVPAGTRPGTYVAVAEFMLCSGPYR